MFIWFKSCKLICWLNKEVAVIKPVSRVLNGWETTNPSNTVAAGWTFQLLLTLHLDALQVSTGFISILTVCGES